MLAGVLELAFFLYRRNGCRNCLAYALGPDGAVRLGRDLAGWYVTEIGRQPWLVTGVLRTADASALSPGDRSHSRLLYLALYAVLLVTYLSVLVHLALKAGKEGDNEPKPAVENRAMSQPVES
jgi:cytochrome d ubiquinol oxidase subunit I